MLGWLLTSLLSRPLEQMEQSGWVDVRLNDELEVFYPRPYASTPNLTFPISLSHFKVLKQRPDGFKIKVVESHADRSQWQAVGVPAAR
jgi:hypothetical protein